MAFTTAGLNVLNSIDSATLLVFILTFIVVAIYFLTQRDTRVPPGPPLVPILGNLLSVASKDSLGNLARLRKKYGDIYGLYIGKELTVVLNGYDVIHDAIIKKGSLFSRRPMTPFTTATDVYPGIITANDKLWKDQRSFTMRALQQLCFKNSSGHIEEIILSESRKLLDKIEERNAPVNLKKYLSVSVANVISSVLWSKTYDLEDPEFTGFLNRISKNTASVVRKLVIVNCFPFLLKLPFDVLDMKTVFYGITTWKKMFDRRTQNEEPTDKTNDFVDLYLQAVKENEDKKLGQTYSKWQLSNTTFDLLVAGSDTSATSLNWLLLYILHDTELETRLHAEIDDVIGRKREPSLSDRASMPFMEATILECLRIAHVAPLAIPHSVNHDVMFHDYLIQKDTTVVVNLHSVMMDPNLWEDPCKFRPERFLSADLKVVEIPKHFIPFSAGPRSCPGETLAKMEIFLYITSLLQKFRLLPADDSCMPEIKGVLGATYNPEPYEIRLVKR